MKLPNQTLICNLLEKYYRNDGSSGQDPFISSYWKYYSQFFEIEVDAEGNLVNISGGSFGNCQWRGRRDRLLNQACIASHLLHLPQRYRLLKLMQTAVKVCQTMGLDLTFDVFRQICTLELLDRHLPQKNNSKRILILVIGDGYGVLSALFKSIFPNATVVLVDLGKTLLFQTYHCQKAYPDCVHELIGKDLNLDKVDFLYCPTECLEMLSAAKFDLAVNIASMQEMNMTTVKRYFDFLRRNLRPQHFFYCCNRESKTLPGGEVSEFLNYPWHEQDIYMVDEKCPWHQYFFGQFPANKGLYLLRARVPFVNFYDGPHRHRLAILKTACSGSPDHDHCSLESRL